MIGTASGSNPILATPPECSRGAKQKAAGLANHTAGGPKLIIASDVSAGLDESRLSRDDDQGVREGAHAADRERQVGINHGHRSPRRVMVAYVCSLLPLICLGPGIMEATLDAREPKGLKFATLVRAIPNAREIQR